MKKIYLALLLCLIGVNSYAGTSTVGTMWNQVNTTVSPADDVTAVDLSGVSVTLGSTGFTGIENHSAVLDNATGNQVGFTYNIIADKASSGDATGFKIDCTDTSSPGLYRCLDIKYDGVSLVNSNANGEFNINTDVNTGFKFHEGAGTGTFRYYRGGVLQARFTFGASGAFNIDSRQTQTFKTIDSADTNEGFIFNGVTNSSLSAAMSPTLFKLIRIYNQTSGDAGSVNLELRRTDTALGSGNHYYANYFTNETSMFSITNRGIVASRGLAIDTNDVDTVAVAIFGNLSTSCKLFIVQSDPEGRVPGNECDRAYGINGSGKGLSWIKRTGSGNTGWLIQSIVPSLSSIWVNGVSVQSTIINQSAFVGVEHFVNIGEEDSHLNAVADVSADGLITIGVDGGGDYRIYQEASTKMDLGTNIKILVIPKITLATQKIITDATNATPIVITTSAPHLLKTGDYVTQEAVGGNTAANGDFYVTAITPTTYSLHIIDESYSDTTGNGSYTSGGTVDAVYPGNIAQPISRSSSLFGRGASSGTHDLFAGDIVSLSILNRTNANEVDFTQISLGIKRIEME